MDTTQLVAAVTLLESAKGVAILPVAADDADAVATSLALAQVLKLRGVDVHVYPGGEPHAGLAFLTGHNLIDQAFAPTSELTLRIPTDKSKAPVAGLTYERTDDALTVHVTAQSGSWSPRDVAVTSGWQQSWDCVVIVGAPRLGVLGQRFTKHAELFYQTPLVSLAYQPDAENFAQANLHDRTARSCAEIAAQLLRHWERSTLTAPVATALYAGLMAATESFQKSMTSPAQFELAATLLDAGADRLGVVRHLYKTKPLAHLKLWGRVLGRLTTSLTSDGTRVAHAALSAADVTAAGANLDAIHELLATVLVHAPDVDLVGVLAEPAAADRPAGSTQRIRAFVASSRGEALNVARRLGAATGSPKVAQVELVATSLDHAQQELLRACDAGARAGYTGQALNKDGKGGTGQPERTSHTQEVSSRQTGQAVARR